MNRLPGGFAFNQWLYRLAARISALYLRQEEIVALFVRGSLGRGNHVPGLSDIDLNIVVTTPLEAFREYTARIGGEYGRFLERFYPVFAGADPDTVDMKDLVSWYRAKFGAIRREADAITDLYLERLNASGSAEPPV